MRSDARMKVGVVGACRIALFAVLVAGAGVGPAHAAALPRVFTNGSYRVTVLNDPAFKYDYTLSAMAVSPDGKLLATGHPDHEPHVRTWDLKTGRPLRRFTAAHHVISVGFSPDSAKVFSLCMGGMDCVEVWDIASGRKEATVKGAQSMCRPAFSPDQRFFAERCGIGGSQSRMHLLDLAQGKAVHTFNGSDDALVCKFLPDGQTMASGNNDGVVKLWGVTNGQLLHTFPALTAAVDDLFVSADGRTLAAVSRAGEVTTWEVASRGQVAAFQIPGIEPLHGSGGSGYPKGQGLFQACFSADGRRVLAAASDHFTCWDIAKGSKISDFGAGGLLTALSPDGTLAIVITQDDERGRLAFWNTDTGALTRTSDFGLSPLAISPDGRRLALRGHSPAGVWDLVGRKPAWVRDTPTEWTHACFSPDGARVAVVTQTRQEMTRQVQDEALEIWETASGRLTTSLPLKGVETLWFGPSNTVCAVLRPEGARSSSLASTVVLVGRTDTARITPQSQTSRFLGVQIDLNTKEVSPRLEFECAQGQWPSFAFTPDGSLLTGGLPNEMLGVWDVGARKRVAQTDALDLLCAHGLSRAAACAARDNGRILVTSGKTREVHALELGPEGGLQVRGTFVGSKPLAISGDGAVFVCGNAAVRHKGHDFFLTPACREFRVGQWDSWEKTATLRNLVWPAADGQGAVVSTVASVVFLPGSRAFIVTSENGVACLYEPVESPAGPRSGTAVPEGSAP